jgi:hypothetical protein
VNFHNPHHRKVLEESIAACLRLIDGADPGKEEQVFSEFAPLAIQFGMHQLVNQRDDGANEIGLDGSGPFPTRHSRAGEHHQHSVSLIGDQP